MCEISASRLDHSSTTHSVSKFNTRIPQIDSLSLHAGLRAPRVPPEVVPDSEGGGTHCDVQRGREIDALCFKENPKLVRLAPSRRARFGPVFCARADQHERARPIVGTSKGTAARDRSPKSNAKFRRTPREHAESARWAGERKTATASWPCDASDARFGNRARARKTAALALEKSPVSETESFSVFVSISQTLEKRAPFFEPLLP